jgi:Tfp pilus assembly ATPase PilU
LLNIFPNSSSHQRIPNKLRKITVTLPSVLLLLIIAACGSGESTDSASVSTTNDGEEKAPVMRIDETFTIEQFQTVLSELSVGAE